MSDAIKWTDSDVINIDDFIPAGEYNPHNVRPWLLHDHGVVLAVVFADCLQDAIDEAVDNGKLDRFSIAEEDRGDYPNDDDISYLGNAGEPFDIDSLGAVELVNPALSFRALFDAYVANAE